MFLLEADDAAVALQAAEDALLSAIESDPHLMRSTQMSGVLVSFKGAIWALQSARNGMKGIRCASETPPGVLQARADAMGPAPYSTESPRPE